MFPNIKNKFTTSLASKIRKVHAKHFNELDAIFFSELLGMCTDCFLITAQTLRTELKIRRSEVFLDKMRYANWNIYQIFLSHAIDHLNNETTDTVQLKLGVSEILTHQLICARSLDENRSGDTKSIFAVRFYWREKNMKGNHFFRF